MYLYNAALANGQTTECGTQSCASWVQAWRTKKKAG